MSENAPFLWYAVHTRSRHENKVYQQLLTKSIHAFLPMIETWSRRKDRRKKIHIPLFPGYLFIEVAMDNKVWLNVLKTPGVVRVLGNCKRCIPVPEREIKAAQILVDSHALVTPYPYLKVGQMVRVIRGPLMGCEGILLREKPKCCKLVISVEILGQSAATEIHEADVEPIA